MDIIKDGTGSGNLAAVDGENRLLTSAITYSGEHTANHEFENAYNMLFEITPTTGNCFLYLKNGHTLDISIEGLWLRTDSAEQVIMKLGDTGTPSSGSAITPANVNAGANSTALGTFQSGNNITGLSGGTIINKGWITNTATSFFNFEQDVIVPPNLVYTLYAVTGGVALAGTIVFNYHSHT